MEALRASIGFSDVRSRTSAAVRSTAMSSKIHVEDLSTRSFRSGWKMVQSTIRVEDVGIPREREKERERWKYIEAKLPGEKIRSEQCRVSNYVGYARADSMII